jgi:hypothetical protein
MGMNSIPMRTFLNSVQKWVRAMEQQQTQDARFFVEQLHVASEMLAFDPEFKRIFRDNHQRGDIADPESIVRCLSDFFHAVTDAAQPGRFRANQVTAHNGHDGHDSHDGTIDVNRKDKDDLS